MSEPLWEVRLTFTFAVDELFQLGLAERVDAKGNPGRWSREDLARLHFVKTEFSATAVG